MALKILTIEDGRITFKAGDLKYTYWRQYHAITFNNVIGGKSKIYEDCLRCERVLNNGAIFKFQYEQQTFSLLCLRCFMKDKIVTRKELNYIRTLAELN